MKSVLYYHVYPVNQWRSLSQYLLKDIPHDAIIVHISVSLTTILNFNFLRALFFFKKNAKVLKILFSFNSKTPEVNGFRKVIPYLKDFSILTYMHGKGVTKPDNKNIKDWVELMRFFNINKFDIIKQKFKEGKKLYGVNLGVDEASNNGPYKFSDFHFSGNFVSVNLALLYDKIVNTPIDNDYFGLEGYWGKLTTLDFVFCPFIANITNHYHEPFPFELYCNE